MAKERTLVGLDYSPWTEKCRWALDHHHVPYRYEPYTPMIGEPGLRLRLRRPFGKVTVPVLFLAEGTVLDESWDIAQLAEHEGRGAPLFPEEHAGAIRDWDGRAQDACSLGRAFSIRRTMEDKDALLAQMDAAPKVMRPLLRPAAIPMVKLFAAKYTSVTPSDESELRQSLIALRDALGGRDTIFDTLTYADIVMAVTLQFVEPVADRHVALDPRIRPTWGDPALAEEFADLLGWRDRLYEARRG